jgi:RNA polymerase sigma-70 factor (ECF subfamily)
MLSITRPDEELMAGVARGDARSFAELHRRHGRRVLLQARALCATAEQAEDVTQEAFLSVWRLAHAFDPARGSFLSWAAAIVRNRATDAWRRAASRPAEVAFLPELSQRLHATDDAAGAALDRAALAELVALLPPEQRAAIFLAYFEDLTAQQIATRVGVPLGTAKSRTRLGLARLRRAAADPTAAARPVAA